MKEYQKIETLYKFNQNTHLYDEEFYTPIIQYLSPLAWLVSEKIDGTNIRVNWDGHAISYSGRTDSSILPDEAKQLLDSTFSTPDAEVIFEQNFGEKNVFLFMECYGGKIQGRLYNEETKLIGFDVMVNDIYLDRNCIKPIFGLFGIDVVPMWTVSNLAEAIQYVQVKRETLIPHTRPTDMEGLVCVPTCRNSFFIRI